METDPFARWRKAQDEMDRTVAVIRESFDSIERNQAVFARNLERMRDGMEPEPEKAAA